MVHNLHDNDKWEQKKEDLIPKRTFSKWITQFKLIDFLIFSIPEGEKNI